MGSLHFTLGKDAGKLLAQVAQEHLLYNLDPKKAVETFTKSLVGLPSEMAIKLLSGELVIEVEDNGVNVNVVPRDENKHSDYPKPDFIGWYKRENRDIRESGNSIRLGLEDLQRYITSHSGVFEFEFNYKAIGKFISENDFSEIEEIIDTDVRIENIRRLFKVADFYLRKTYKTFNIFDFLESIYPEQINPFNGCVTGVRYMVVNEVAIKLNSLLEYNYNLIEASIYRADEGIKSYLEAAQNIARELKSIIRPMDITRNYSAGWLAPDGKFYGLDGAISNMLHLNLADAIRRKYKQEDGLDIGDNPDRWLEENGWVKIHGNWILYSGYDQHQFKRKDIPLTDIQKKNLAVYGNTCHSGVLMVGFEKKAIPAVRLEIVDDVMLRNYFSL
ncbi:hypothetical protein ACIXT9_02210 [Bacteroides fragilis]